MINMTAECGVSGRWCDQSEKQQQQQQAQAQQQRCKRGHTRQTGPVIVALPGQTCTPGSAVAAAVASITAAAVPLTLAIDANWIDGALIGLKHQGAGNSPNRQHRYECTQYLSTVIAKGVMPGAWLCGSPGRKDADEKCADIRQHVSSIRHDGHTARNVTADHLHGHKNET